MEKGILKVGDLVKSKWQTAYNKNDYGIVMCVSKSKSHGYIAVAWTDDFFSQWQPESSLDLISDGIS
tara:strand:- start:1363 stop:1563 length:201 start_codon:yes stop_codon:yes gene_type:complete